MRARKINIVPRRRVDLLIRTAGHGARRYDALRLDKNERCTGYQTPAVQAMLKGISGRHLSAYPEPWPLYEKIAKWHGVKTDQLTLTAGSELAIRYLFEAFLNPGDQLVLLNPSFAMFEVYGQLCGARVVKANFDRQWHVDPQDVLRLIGSRTKLVALANPNNPTGTVLDEVVLQAILHRAARYDALVLLDEAYYHFYKRTMLNHLPRFNNLVLTRTFSKACGIAGVRLGYAVGHPRVIAAINKVQPIDHVNVFAVKVGEYLVDHEELIEDYVRQTVIGRGFLVGALSFLGFPVRDSHANFVLLDLGPSRDRIARALSKRRVLLGTSLRLPFPSTFVRVTAGPIAVMRRFVTALKEVLREEHIGEGADAGRPRK